MAVTWPTERTKHTGKPLKCRASSIEDISHHVLSCPFTLVDPLVMLCRLPATSYTHQVAYPCPYTLSRQASANLLHFDVSSKTPSFVIQNNAIFKFPIESEFDKMYIPTENPHLFFLHLSNIYIFKYAEQQYVNARFYQ